MKNTCFYWIRIVSLLETKYFLKMHKDNATMLKIK